MGSRPRRTATRLYRVFLVRGWTPIEASNMVAWRVGLRPLARGWAPVEIERVLWWRWLVLTRRVGGPTDGLRRPPRAATRR